MPWKALGSFGRLWKALPALQSFVRLWDALLGSLERLQKGLGGFVTYYVSHRGSGRVWKGLGVSGRLWQALVCFRMLLKDLEGFGRFWDALGGFGMLWQPR